MTRIILLLFTTLFYFEANSQENQQFIFVMLNKSMTAPKISKEESDKIMEGHMANINKLANEKKLLAAGPFEGGGGIFVFNTTSIQDVEKWIKPDPGVQAKRWDIEMFTYTPVIGSICPVSEPYEMVDYTFVRYDALVSKFNASTYPEIIEKHNQFIKQLNKSGNVITQGSFGDNEGGILIIKGNIQQEVLESDPGVQEGLLQFQIKKLYIAKGSFCEK